MIQFLGFFATVVTEEEEEEPSTVLDYGTGDTSITLGSEPHTSSPRLRTLLSDQLALVNFHSSGMKQTATLASQASWWLVCYNIHDQNVKCNTSVFYITLVVDTRVVSIRAILSDHIIFQYLLISRKRSSNC